MNTLVTLAGIFFCVAMGCCTLALVGCYIAGQRAKRRALRHQPRELAEQIIDAASWLRSDQYFTARAVEELVKEGLPLTGEALQERCQRLMAQSRQRQAQREAS